MGQLVAFINHVFPRRTRRLPAPGWWLAASLMLSAFGCAGAPPTDNPPSAVSPSAAAPPSATPLVAASATAVPASSQTLPVTLVATPGSLGGLEQELALADQEMTAARASATLQDAQQHAQAVINTLVGAWGRWYDVGRFDDPSDRRGVFPGERIPGPANGTSTDLTPIGWGIRAYDQVDPASRPVIQTIMGDVKRWRDNPRARYDDIERAIAGAQPNPSRIDRLDGRAMRALAWARLIIVQASTLDQARQDAQAGSQEIAAAVAAAQTIP